MWLSSAQSVTKVRLKWTKWTYICVNHHSPDVWKEIVPLTNSCGPEVIDKTDPERGDSFTSSPGSYYGRIYN